MSESFIRRFRSLELMPRPSAQSPREQPQTTANFTNLSNELRTKMYNEIFADEIAPRDVWSHQRKGAEQANVFKVAVAFGHGFFGFDKATFRCTCRRVFHASRQLRDEILECFFGKLLRKTTLDMGTSRQLYRFCMSLSQQVLTRITLVKTEVRLFAGPGAPKGWNARKRKAFAHVVAKIRTMP